jgi:hypothetical protein
MSEDTLTPVEAERLLYQLYNDMSRARADLRDARDAEVTAKHVYQSKHRRMLLSRDCPKVTRGGYTTAERDAWVALQAEAEEQAFDLAEAKRKAAEDNLRTVRDQGVMAATLLKSANQAFAMAGTGER